MNYQMGAMEETAFKQLVAQQTGQDASVFENMTIEQIGEMMHVELKSFRQEKEDEDGNKVEVTCVDVRPIFASMLESGQMEKDDVLSMRDSMEKTLDTMGSSLVKSMGIAYAVSADKAAGLDIDRIQKSYLLTAGLKMVGMALLMGVVTVFVGLFASRVAAGIGRDLRDQVFKKVVGFSNAEMDQFSTASLITRSTNDIQQIQMVSVLLLRMIAYAPILGIGGVVKVVKTGAGMGWIIVLAIIVIISYVMLLVSITMPKFKQMQKLVDNINLVSREILTGLSVIRAFGREDKEEERFDTANRELTGTTLFTNRVMTFMMPGMMMIMNVLTVGIVWFGAHRINEGTMQVGAMTAFITYAMMIVMSFLMLTMMSIMLPRAAVAAGRIDEVIRTELSIQDAKNAGKIRRTQWCCSSFAMSISGIREQKRMYCMILISWRSGKDNGNYRKYRLRKINAGKPDSASLRCDGRTDYPGWERYPKHYHEGSARRDWLCAAERRAVLGNDRIEPALRKRKCNRCRDRKKQPRLHRQQSLLKQKMINMRPRFPRAERMCPADRSSVWRLRVRLQRIRKSLFSMTAFLHLT